MQVTSDNTGSGDTVRYSLPASKKADSRLLVGKEYTVRYLEVGAWNTYLYLLEVGGAFDPQDFTLVRKRSEPTTHQVMNTHYECHITCHLKDAKIAEKVAVDLHWKTSEIARDPVLGKDSYFYLTSHSLDYNSMFSRMEQAAIQLREAGVEVLREKIEHIVYDTKTMNKTVVASQGTK